MTALPPNSYRRGPDERGHFGTYGGRYHPQLGPTEPDLDHFELEIVERVLERRMPLLAICRGAQVLNVALGGDLYQHLPDEPGGPIDHRKRTPDAPDTAHDVEVDRSTVLAGALHVDGSCHVNSFHHQAAHHLGKGLVPVADDDGIVRRVSGAGEFRSHARRLTPVRR